MFTPQHFIQRARSAYNWSYTVSCADLAKLQNIAMIDNEI